jgi:hypothetical protein
VTADHAARPGPQRGQLGGQRPAPQRTPSQNRLSLVLLGVWPEGWGAGWGVHGGAPGDGGLIVVPWAIPPAMSRAAVIAR